MVVTMHTDSKMHGDDQTCLALTQTGCEQSGGREQATALVLAIRVRAEDMCRSRATLSLTMVELKNQNVNSSTCLQFLLSLSLPQSCPLTCFEVGY